MNIAEQLPTEAGIDKLDKLRFRDFLTEVFGGEYPDTPDELARLLQNLSLATDDGHLNLAGMLMLAERPERIAPQFVVRAICYPGNDIHATDYFDTEDYAGPLPKVFEDSLWFIMRNLHKVQAGRGVNAPGTPEVPEVVFEELLVNALVHRDYFVSAPIRLFVFDDRIEIISPGHLPDNLTVEHIRAGTSNIRNPILISFVAKGLLPYHGLGSGIRRALERWPDIEFIDDPERNLFIATVRRPQLEGQEQANIGKTVRIPSAAFAGSEERRKRPNKASEKTSENVGKEPIIRRKRLRETSEKILEACQKRNAITIAELADLVGITERSVERNLQNLQRNGWLRRVGGRKTGRWEVVDD